MQTVGRLYDRVNGRTAYLAGSDVVVLWRVMQLIDRKHTAWNLLSVDGRNLLTIFVRDKVVSVPRKFDSIAVQDAVI